MTNGRVEIITSVQRRRRWRSTEKEQLVAASLEAGASVSAVAREAGIHPSQLYGWRRQLRAQAQLSFAPVQIASEAAPTGQAGPATIEIEFAADVRKAFLNLKAAPDPFGILHGRYNRPDLEQMGLTATDCDYYLLQTSRTQSMIQTDPPRGPATRSRSRGNCRKVVNAENLTLACASAVLPCTKCWGAAAKCDAIGH